MRSISSTLTNEQKKPTRKPLVKVEVQAYGHPQKASSIQWRTFAWERLYQGSETKNFHSMCVAGDGSLNRLRLDNTTIKHSRVASPGPSSDYTSWSNRGNTVASSHLAIAAHGAEVIIVAAGTAYTWRLQSSDYGATWGSWVEMSNTRPCERGCAIAYKSNGDCAIVHASDVNDPESLYIQTRTSGYWSSGLGQRTGNWDIEGLAMYYDGDWNIIAPVLEGSNLVVYRMVYGDGDRVTAGTWADDVKIGLGRAHVDIEYMLALRQFGSQWRVGQGARKTPTYYEKHQAVLQEQAAEVLGVSGCYLHKPSSYNALFSLARQNTPWLFRLASGTDFYDSDWNKADTINTSAAYGLALDSDSNYIWATQANEVWRSPSPGSWTAPTAGSGAGSKITLPVSKIVRILESVDPERASELEVELDNSKGTYDSPGSGSLAVVKRGARVNLHLGYKASSGDELSEAARYFIESLEYNRADGRALFKLNCIDAWGLLEHYQFNKPVEWNMGSDDYSVYGLIELIMSSVGGALSYKSRSSLITSLYPRLEVRPGESAAGILRQLLSFVPDVIFFFGLDAYIVYPQSGDSSVYDYKFPL